ncbi:MAG: tetratricopeptide repeat protein [Candidatus Melainabacteria bacterium]|nr:tetratricopeptide repeat protein [Candidatus Melainabacteria bacterium]
MLPESKNRSRRWTGIKCLFIAAQLAITVVTGNSASHAQNHNEKLEGKRLQAALSHARQSIVKARVLGGKMTAKQAQEFYEEADKLADHKCTTEARELMMAVCATKHAKPDYFLLLSRTYKTELGDTESGRPANKYLDKALAIDPNFSEAWLDKASICLADGNLEQAEKYVDRALACKPPNPDCFHVKANILATKKRFKEALVWIEKSEKVDPDSTSIYRDKATILENLNRYDEAILAYKRAYELKQQDWTIFQIVRCLETQKRYGEAINSLSMLLKANPNDGEAYRTRARLKLKNKDLPGALQDLNRNIDLEPTATSYTERANIYKLMGDKTRAEADLKAAKKLVDSPF